MKILIGIMLYLLVGVWVATSPKRRLKKIDDEIKSGDYEPLEVYDLLLFETVMEVSNKSTKVLVFIGIVLFYPILFIKNKRKQKRRDKY